MGLCCLHGRRPWCCCNNYGVVSSTLWDGVTICSCITSIDISYNLGSEGTVVVAGYADVDGGNYTLESCIGGAVWTGGSGAGDCTVKHCKAYVTCSESLHVLSPTSKLGVFDDGDLVRSEMISTAYWWRKSD